MASAFVRIALGIASGQHGVLSRQQLLARGIPPSTVTGRIESRFLFPVFDGVYTVGRPDLTLEGLWMASILAAGPGAVLAGRSAATAWGFMDHQHSVDVVRESGGKGKPSLLPLAGTRTWPYLFVSRVRALPSSEVRAIHGIPVVTPARAALELAGLLAFERFDRAFMEADRLGLLADNELFSLAGKTRGKKGGAHFRRMVTRRIPGIKRAKSIMEGIFLRLSLENGIRPPAVNTMVLGKEMDFVWFDEAVIVECDSWEFHRGLEAFEEDALESNRLRAAGWTVLRFTWRMVAERPDEVAEMVRKALTSPSARRR